MTDTNVNIWSINVQIVQPKPKASVGAVGPPPKKAVAPPPAARLVQPPKDKESANDSSAPFQKVQCAWGSLDGSQNQVLCSLRWPVLLFSGDVKLAVHKLNEEAPFSKI